jgi:hypothetical protein
MIRYPYPRADIEALVKKRKPRWAKKARDRTAVFARLGGYVTSEIISGKEKKLPDFWGDVKEVFMDLQFGKCLFCEMPLEVGDNTSIQWDLEHFRPKGNVRAWPLVTPGQFTSAAGVKIATGDPMPEGYYLLAYHLGNYGAACKTCNSPYKSDFFPIAGNRVVGGTTPEDHSAENAFLIYPLGETAENPEDFLTFDGVEAKPRGGSVRGELMIAFFDLNRDGLQAARARWLRHTVWHVVRLALQGDADAVATLTWLLSLEAPHTNCTRCFVEVCRTDIARAQSMIPLFDAIIKKFPQKQPV